MSNETRIAEAIPYGFDDTSFQAAGGIKGIKRLANRFYDIVDSHPKAKELRALYPEDLTESREKLGRYLCGWLGGPKKYQEKYGSITIAKAHEHVEVNARLGEIWLLCMHRAIDSQPYSEKFAAYLKEQFRFPIKRILDHQSKPSS